MHREDQDHAYRAKLLSSYGWLSRTSPTFIDSVIALGRWKKVYGGERVTTAGEEKSELIALAEGVATLSSNIGYAETPLVHIFRPPFWWGYTYLVGSGPRRYTCEMRTSGWLLSIDGKSLERLMNRETAAWPAMVRLAIGHTDLAATVAGDLVTRGSRKRTLAVLLRCSGHRDSDSMDAPPLKSIPLTQAELADASNLSRNTVVTVLQELAAKNLVGLSRRSIEIKNPSALLKMLNEDE